MATRAATWRGSSRSSSPTARCPAPTCSRCRSTTPTRRAAAGDYQRLLELHGGQPLQLDLVHLGLGSDGHTASLVPGDPVLEVDDRDVAVTGEYQGLRRMTLTLPALGRARRRLWLVSGAAKAARLRQLLAGVGEIPAVRVPRHATLVICDEAAAG